METQSQSESVPFPKGLDQRLLSLLRWHFTTTTQTRSKEQEEAERHILGVRFRRWFMIPAAILIQLCVGSYVGWTVYNIPIEEHINAQPGSSAVTMFIAMGMFGVAAGVFGPWVDRVGPRFGLLAGGTVNYLGHIVTAVGVYFKSMALVYFGYGVLAGSGLGIIILCPIGPLLKWYPDKRGLISALGVAGFSGGTMLFTMLEGVLIPRMGVPWTLSLLGSIYYAMYVLCSFVLRTPPQGYTVNMHTHTQNIVAVGVVEAEDVEGRKGKFEEGGPKEELVLEGEKNDATKGKDTLETSLPARHTWTIGKCLRSQTYWATYFMFLAVCLPLFVMGAKLSDMCQLQFGKSQTAGAAVVAGTAAVSLVSRIWFGLLSDKFGRKNLFMFSLIVQVGCLFALPPLFNSRNFVGFVAIITVMSVVNIGPTLAPAFIVDLFGGRNMGPLYGLLMTAAPTLVGVVGGSIFAAIYRWQANIHGHDAPNVYDIDFYWMAAVTLVGFGVGWTIKV